MENKYCFYGRLKEEFPSQIIVDVSEVCNLACIHCPYSDYVKSNILKKSFLDLELNKKMADEVKKYGNGNTQQIRYTANGEPLLHPQIFEMLKYSVEESGVFVSITTNGTLLNEVNINKLLDTGINMIDISIDAYNETTYSNIRKKGDLKVVKNNILNLLKRRKECSNKLKVVVSFVEQEINKNETYQFKEYWEEQGVNFVIIRRLHSAGGANEAIASKIKSINRVRRPCVYPWERIILNAKGFLSYCPAAWDGRADIVDFKETTIYETWHSSFYKNLREGNIKNNLSNFEFCNQCPDWVQTRWPDVGRGYGDMIGEFSK